MALSSSFGGGLGPLISSISSSHGVSAVTSHILPGAISSHYPHGHHHSQLHNHHHHLHNHHIGHPPHISCYPGLPGSQQKPFLSAEDFEDMDISSLSSCMGADPNGCSVGTSHVGQSGTSSAGIPVPAQPSAGHYMGRKTIGKSPTSGYSCLTTVKQPVSLLSVDDEIAAVAQTLADAALRISSPREETFRPDNSVLDPADIPSSSDSASVQSANNRHTTLSDHTSAASVTVPIVKGTTIAKSSVSSASALSSCGPSVATSGSLMPGFYTCLSTEDADPAIVISAASGSCKQLQHSNTVSQHIDPNSQAATSQTPSSLCYQSAAPFPIIGKRS
ncbi:unnamed protein product [Protopolystoma xenopodis]|uniref:Uncharacterized protein n=1 Tax=Protopolystoma xenopodis TaxID=117903 RepID=A0A448XI91_9PLAT|nr:unnamed protein product [Protopolystoma xenopodis]